MIIDLGADAQKYMKVMDKDIAYKRSSVKTSLSGGKISIRIAADDATALVASMNSMLKQIRIISAVRKVVKKSPESRKR